MTSTISHKIKARENANDVFITPLGLAKSHIDLHDVKEGEIWLDPCKNNGSYYNQFPDGVQKEYCEILEDKDFLTFEGKVDVIVQNPPYSMLDAWFKKNIELNPRSFSMLIGVGNLTARRIEWCEEAGYGITKLRMMKVHKWYGMSYIVVFEKNKPSIMEIDRKVWKEDKPKTEKKKKEKKEKKERLPNTCGRCKEVGHNKRTCKNELVI